MAFEQPGDGAVVEAGPGTEPGEQAAYPVAGAGGLCGEGPLEAAEHGELGGDSSVSSSGSRVCGTVRAASLVSVFTSPGKRPATRRMGEPGRQAALRPAPRATVSGRALTEAGWSATTTTVPHFSSGLSKTFCRPDRPVAVAVVGTPADVQAAEHTHVFGA